MSPLLGWHLESASIAAAVGGLPEVVKVGAKFLVAWPFTFHALSGVRHLFWDFGVALKNREVMLTGWAVVGGSLVTAGGLAVL